VSLAVVLAGLIYLWRGWAWIDPAISVAIALVIVVSTWSLFRHSLSLLFDGVPAHVVFAPDADPDTVLHEATQMLRHGFGIAHVTLQLETEAYAAQCEREMCNTV
jgi:cobalt-zinc-cadmium efflux system protein